MQDGKGTPIARGETGHSAWDFCTPACSNPTRDETLPENSIWRTGRIKNVAPRAPFQDIRPGGPEVALSSGSEHWVTALLAAYPPRYLGYNVVITYVDVPTARYVPTVNVPERSQTSTYARISFIVFLSSPETID